MSIQIRKRVAVIVATALMMVIPSAVVRAEYFIQLIGDHSHQQWTEMRPQSFECWWSGETVYVSSFAPLGAVHMSGTVREADTWELVREFESFMIAAAACFDITRNQWAGWWVDAEAHTLDSAGIYTAAQRELIRTLYGYAYSTGFNSDGTIRNEIFAQAFQLALWSVLYETSDDFSLFGGTFGLWGEGDYDPMLIYHTDALLGALTGGGSWSDLGMTFTDYELTVFTSPLIMAMSASFSPLWDGDTCWTPQMQAWIMATATDTAVIPEPATLAIVGLGLVGLGVARRRMRK